MGIAAISPQAGRFLNAFFNAAAENLEDKLQYLGNSTVVVKNLAREFRAAAQLATRGDVAALNSGIDSLRHNFSAIKRESILRRNGRVTAFMNFVLDIQDEHYAKHVAQDEKLKADLGTYAERLIPRL